MIVYLATNTVNGMQYVGATINFEKRVREHFRAGERDKGKRGSIAKAIKKFGKEAFSFEKIDEATSLTGLSKKEARWINKLGTLAPNGYNKTSGGYSPAPKEVVPIEVGGIVYPSLAEAVRSLRPAPLSGAAGGHSKRRSIGVKGVTERMNSGWTVDQAFGITKPPAYRQGVKYCKSGKVWIVEGRQFDSLQHAADHYGVPLYRTKARVQRGWTIGQAVGAEVREQKRKHEIEITVGGRIFANLKSAADFYGVKEGTVGSRKRLGWTPEEIFGVFKRPTKHPMSKPITVGGVTFQKHKEAAEFYGIKENVFSMRLRSGCTPEQAAGIEPKPRKKHHSAKETTVFGKTYASVDDACRHLSKQNGLNFNTVKGRLHRGWSIEDAVSIPLVEQASKQGDHND